MSLIKCPECHHEVSTEADNCPHCGYPLNKEHKEVIENTPIEIKQWQSEIRDYSRRRVTMIVFGSILTVIGLILFGVFTGLFVRDMATLGSQHGSAGQISQTAIGYMGLMILASFIFAGGTALVVVGAVVNSVKIKKRENKIRYYKQTGEILR